MVQEKIDWPAALRAPDHKEQTAAVSALRAVLHRGLRLALQGRADVSAAHLEDFTQEGLLRVLGRLDQFQDRSRFTTWAHSIALNTAFTELRRKRWQDVSLDALLAAGDRLAEPAVIADDVLGAAEDRTRLIAVLREAIERDLTPKQRMAILASLRDMPFDQIAALLGISSSAAYKLLHDARRALKSRLQAAGITVQDIRTTFNP